MSSQDHVERFAHELSRLREQAGNPSYRHMAMTSGCISHSSLHNAARGTRFPQWETVEQFVVCCGGDVEDWRRRWAAAAEEVGQDGGTEERAERGAASAPSCPAGDGPQLGRSSEHGEAETAAAATRRERGGRRSFVLCAAVAGIIGLAIGAVIRPAFDGFLTRVSENDAAAVDASQFLEDVTIPDGQEVRSGATVLKTWRLQNAGDVDWVNRYLQRSDASSGVPCATPERVLVPDTHAGDVVDISVRVEVREDPGQCRVEWKMVDASGKDALPAARPLYFHLQAV